MVELSPEALGTFQNVRVDSFLVNLRQDAVLHQDLAVDHGGLALTAGHAEEHVTVNVGVGEGGEGLVVHDDHVGSSAGTEYTQGGEARPGRHFGVVLEEHVRYLAPTDVGHAGIVALDGEGHLDAFEHVVGVGVRAKSHQNALFIKLQNGGAAYGVAHVGLGIVDAHGIGGLNDVHFGGVDVDAVAQNSLGA